MFRQVQQTNQNISTKVGLPLCLVVDDVHESTSHVEFDVKVWKVFGYRASQTLRWCSRETLFRVVRAPFALRLIDRLFKIHRRVHGDFLRDGDAFDDSMTTTVTEFHGCLDETTVLTLLREHAHETLFEISHLFPHVFVNLSGRLRVRDWRDDAVAGDETSRRREHEVRAVSVRHV